MTFEYSIPDDMQQCIEKWRNYAKHQGLEEDEV